MTESGIHHGRGGHADDDAALAAWLAVRDEPCPVCAHNLRGVPGPVCPECGAPLRLSVGSENNRQGPWLLALGAFVLALGFDAVTTLLMSIPVAVYLGMTVVIGQQPGPGPGIGFFMVVGMMLTLSVAMASAAYVFIKRANGWKRMDRRRQWWAAWGLFVGVGAAHVVAGAVAVLLIT